MTPHEQRLLDVVHAAASDILAGFKREHIPTTTAFAITCQVAIDLLDRMEPGLRHDIAAALVARLSPGQHLDA